MNAVAERSPALVAPDAQTLSRLRDLDAAMLALPQTEIAIDHLIHGGMYARTAHVPADQLVSGALLHRATVLVISGDVTVFTGTDAVRLTGFHILPGSAGRKQLFRTHTETHMTMVLRSDAQSVDEAEHEFTSEPELLMKSAGSVTITGEKA
ncbi:hypothetical protein [Paraburkholderia sartisoli]|uniref:Uncharacterized protein n=1 Tax=Paraburkholderia sartisoli TaxID=83784 RepID=A0A1H4HSY6_9BURK|nr:hypothetical protein [Paraburkholderia sartisoli]SEB24781.1 hypothetical protein SAMN05192564_11530 [Paraburkholderia sartisoli]